MRKVHVCYWLAFITIGCHAPTQSEVKFETGAGHKRGHEDITRFAVEDANTRILETLGIGGFYPTPHRGVAGADSGNMIIKGNFETDFPERKFLDFYEAKNKIPLVGWLAWHESPHLQHLHGLRNRPDGTNFQDQFATCRETTNAINTALSQALRLMRSDRNSEAGRHWLGHATHIIQDTFSKAHAIRENTRTLVDHCTYGVKDPAICYHNENDTRDEIWEQDNGSCELDPNNRGRSCLVAEAKAAALATAGFLAVAAQLVVNPALDMDRLLLKWFQGDPAIYESGYLDCRPMGMTLLDAYFNFIAGTSLSGEERDILSSKLEVEFIPELKNYLFNKYAHKIIQDMTGVVLENDLLDRYLPYLASHGFKKLDEKIFVADAIEIVKRRVLKVTGKEVLPLWLPQYTNYLMDQRSIAKLDAEIKLRSEATPPTPGSLDRCGNLPTPLEIIKCRTEAAKQPK